MLRILARLLSSLLMLVSLSAAADGNRLSYLDGTLRPYYPHRGFPKLVTPQWVGEEGVECVVTLAIDDMRESAKYELFLRPIIDRLKRIDGRAPVSIMACSVDPADPQLQSWLKEGLSIEVHTFDHPCPCLQDGGLTKAKETYDKCVDLMNQIPGNKPVAFRMPCCDSKNTPSPRFWAEAFNKTTANGNFLQIDSSVFNVITSKDTDLPPEITRLPSGEDRFRRYIPFPNFVNTIEDYPYPYVIGGVCWEFPCVVPSDWSAQHVQRPNNPDTVRDWKLALDAIVQKQGVFNLVFHPHGWIHSEQIVDLIDHAVSRHGKKVKFLTFKECAERLNRHLLLDNPLRGPDGTSRGTILIDAGHLEGSRADGFLDVEFGAGCTMDIRDWHPRQKTWSTRSRPVDLTGPESPKHDRSARHVDIDGDGRTDLLRLNVSPHEILLTDLTGKRNPASFGLPDGVSVAADQPADVLRLIDVNADGKLDCLFSNHERFSLHLFQDTQTGWSTRVTAGVRGKEGGAGPVIPPFVRADGTNNGAWFHSAALWLQNEDTWRLPDNVFKLTFDEMLGR